MTKRATPATLAPAAGLLVQSAPPVRSAQAPLPATPATPPGPNHGPQVEQENAHLLAPACDAGLRLACARNLTALTPAAAARGVEVEGDGAALGCFLQKLRAGDSVTVATLGGSASAAASWHDGIPAMKYPDQLVDALRGRFPSATVRSGS